MSTCKSLISPVVEFRLKEIIDYLVNCEQFEYSHHLYINKSTQQIYKYEDLQLHFLSGDLPFSYGKLTLNSPIKKKNLDTGELKSVHKFEFYFDPNALLEKELTIFYDENFRLEIEFDVTLDPQDENELLLLTLFNTVHYCYSFKEEYLLNIIGRHSELYAEIQKMIGVKVFEAVGRSV